jgi:crossover junction endodeoxyribonuclease RuvC
MIIAGIDYSITSPAVTLFNTDDGEFSFDLCKCIYVNVKPSIQMENVRGFVYPRWEQSIERYHSLAELVAVESDCYFIEDYSFASNGLTFSIGENGGVLKHYIYQKYGKNVNVLAPSTIKKFATGKGNAKKEDMFEAFEKDSKVFSEYDKLKGKSPLADIVDSYFITKKVVIERLYLKTE